MDTRTGKIASARELIAERIAELHKADKVVTADGKAPLAELRRKLGYREIRQFIRPVDIEALNPKVRLEVQKTGRGWISRNSRCPCGSGKRFKRCCMAKGG